jgi:site-specific DNA recombinase
MTMLQLIKKLYELGIPPRKNKEGIWKTSTLTTMLRNETYCGTAYYNRTVAIVPTNPIKNEKYKKIKKSSRKYKDRSEWVPISCPAIISKELFLKVQKQLKTNYQMSQRNKKNQYLLADMMFCTCGCTRAGEGPQKGKHLYYRCTDRVKRYPLTRNCFIKAVNARIADKLVWSEFSNLLTSQDTLERLLKKHITDRSSELTKPNQEQIDSLYAEKKKLEAEEKRYLKAYGAELITYEAFENMVKDVKFKTSQIVEQLNRLSPQTDTVVHTMPSHEDIKQFCDLMTKKMQKTDFEVRRATLRKFIDKIVADQQWLNITGYIPIYLRKEAENVEFRTECRYRRLTQCWQVHTF